MTKKIVANNPTAKHNYTIEDTYEAGIVLTGTEIKSIRNGKVNLKDSYANIKNGEVFIYGMHISPYEHGNIYNKDPLRTRKLLLTRREINKLTGLIKQKGLTLVPMSLYFSGNFLKIELGVGKGKKLYDKRQDIAKKDAEMKQEDALGYGEKMHMHFCPVPNCIFFHLPHSKLYCLSQIHLLFYVLLFLLLILLLVLSMLLDQILKDPQQKFFL